MGFARYYSVSAIVINGSISAVISHSVTKLMITILLLLSGKTFALGLSSPSVSSVVGERFYAVMTVTGVEGIPDNEIFVSLAPRSVYRTMGVEWDYFHSRLIFDVLKDERDQYTIRIVSSDVVFEPYLDFVILLRSPAGSILKQLTVLLDMPAITEKPFAESKSAASLPQQKQATAALNKIQRAVKTDRKTDTPPVVVDEPVKNKDTAVIAANELVASSPDYWSHKTRYGDSLWAVARRMQAEAGGNIKPIVDALYKNNRNAFINNDANRLKVNARLAVTAAQIKAVITSNAALNKQSINKPLSNSINDPINKATKESGNKVVETDSAGQSAADALGVLSLVTHDEQTLPVSAETLELSERSSELADDYDKGLLANKARKRSVEDRIDKLYQQYSAIAEKTDQLTALEQSLNQTVSDKSQSNVATDEAFTIAAETADRLASAQALKPESATQPKQTTDYRHLLLLIAVALGLLLLLVVLLKKRQDRHRAIAVDQWDLADNTFNVDDGQNSLVPEPRVSGFDSEINVESDLDSVALDSETNDEADVESKAAIYIACERFDEAEDLLEQALEIDSDNESLQLQLLEVYAVKGKLRHFELLANQLADLEDDKITIKINYLASKL